MLVLGISVVILGILGAAVDLDRSAYRLAVVMLAIVLLVPRTVRASRIALYRFIEVCIGTRVTLVFTVVWAEMEETQTRPRRQQTVYPPRPATEKPYSIKRSLILRSQTRGRMPCKQLKLTTSLPIAA